MNALIRRMAPAVVLCAMLTACTHTARPADSRLQPASESSSPGISVPSAAPVASEEETLTDESLAAEPGTLPPPEPDAQTPTDATTEVIPPPEGVQGIKTPEADSGLIAVTVQVGDTPFAARFYDNPASQALMAQMPLTIEMRDLNRNEKYVALDDNLPAASTEQPPTIYAGEIMCWSGNSLVLFYDTFANAYGGYVCLGTIEDITGLTAAAGTGSVTVTLSIP